MGSRNVYKRLGYRFAEEMQLIAEEKWILEALTKIKKQRNSLQIERLQLESLKAELNSNVKTDAENQKKAKKEVPSTSTIDLMQNKIPNTNSEIIEAQPSGYQNYEVQCNTEELNLHVTTPVFNRPTNMDNGIEEDESEDDDDNVFIDINMLMNGLRDENVE